MSTTDAGEAARYKAAELAWGSHEPEPILWRDGPWEIELRADELAYIRYDGSPILRSVKAVARDHDWNTFITEVVSSEGFDRGLRLTLRMHLGDASVAGTLDFAATRTDAGDTLTIDLDLVAETAFKRNRLGLVVLHHAEDAGLALRVGHPGGSSTTPPTRSRSRRTNRRWTSCRSAGPRTASR